MPDDGFVELPYEDGRAVEEDVAGFDELFPARAGEDGMDRGQMNVEPSRLPRDADVEFFAHVQWVSRLKMLQCKD